MITFSVSFRRNLVRPPIIVVAHRAPRTPCTPRVPCVPCASCTLRVRPLPTPPPLVSHEHFFPFTIHTHPFTHIHSHTCVVHGNTSTHASTCVVHGNGSTHASTRASTHDSTRASTHASPSHPPPRPTNVLNSSIPQSLNPRRTSSEPSVW